MSTRVKTEKLELREAPAARGVLSASTPDGRLDRARVLPSPDLAPFIHHYGSVRWALRTPYEADTLQHPAARLEFEVHGQTWDARAVGVRTQRFGKRLTGNGRFFIVQFRPATFQPLLQAPLSTLTDRAMPLDALFGTHAARWTAELRAAPNVEAEVRATEALLRALTHELPANVALMRDLVERIAREPTLVRMEQLAQAAALEARTLQRHFRTYVGVQPKWVIRRYRLLEAAERLRSLANVGLADLAMELGYADQAHFARDFRAVVGRTPGAYARDERPSARQARAPARCRDGDRRMR